MNRPTIHASRSFARLLGLEVKGRGPFYIVDLRASDCIAAVAFGLSAMQVAQYLESVDVAELNAQGPCLPIPACRTTLAPLTREGDEE